MTRGAAPAPEWKAAVVADLLAIVGCVSEDNPDAAQAPKDEVEAKVSRLPEHPRLYRVGRVEGTREMVVRRNCIVVHAEDAGDITILRVLHAARQWPGTDAPQVP